MEEFYTTRQIATKLNVNIITVRRWIMRKILPAYLFDREYRIKKTDLDQFLEQRRVNI